ncbi:hypothetical protein ACLQ2A_35920, partial [Streptomyces prasinus]
LLHRERAVDGEAGPALTSESYDQLAWAMIQVLASVDPTGATTDADWHYWTELVQDEAGRGGRRAPPPRGGAGGGKKPRR